jgi:Uma2 family endonuclease
MSIESKLITADEYLQLAHTGVPTELVRGEIVGMNPPQFRHSYLCSRVDRILGAFVEDNDLGITACNDGGVVTQRGPDTVRGADVAFYSIARVPADAPLEGYAPSPDLVVEVRSPSDRMPDILAKVSEYLGAGVDTVVLLDPEDGTASIFALTHGVRAFAVDDVLVLPPPLDSLRHTVRHWLGRALDR